MVLRLGGTAAVLDLLRVVDSHPSKGEGSSGQLDRPGGGKGRLWCLGQGELLRCALNALLNLSMEAGNQVWLAQHQPQRQPQPQPRPRAQPRP